MEMQRRRKLAMDAQAAKKAAAGGNTEAAGAEENKGD
jgi:hypothetical protein